MACRSLDMLACMSTFQSMSRSLAPIRHLRAPEPLDFPTEAEVPEEREHFALRALLFDSLVHAFESYATIGCDQFVYWNGSNPKRCLAPDAFVCWGTPDANFRSWKTWERGTPQTAVEIASVFERTGGPWEEKLLRYRELGVSELVYFDADAAPDARLRIWDRVDDDLVEREVRGDQSLCRSLSGRHADHPALFWVVLRTQRHAAALRLSEDAAGTRLLPTGEEAEQRAREAAERAREAADRAREAAQRDGDVERRARETAEGRVAELEAELARVRAERG